MAYGSRSILILCLLTVGAHADAATSFRTAVSNCRAWFASLGQIKSPALSPVAAISSSMQNTANQVAVVQGSKEWLNWSLEEFLAVEGRVIGFSRDMTYLKLPPVSQRVLSLTHFSSEEKKLIAKLETVSQERKFKARDSVRRYDFFHRLFGGGKPENAVHESEIKSLATERSSSRGVEVGAWVLRTSEGKSFTAIHTSGSSEEVNKNAVKQAIEGLLTSDKINPRDVISVQYFHTHPNGGPLSVGDDASAGWIRNVFDEAGLRPEVHTYAITRVENQTLVFHAGH